MTKRFIYLIGIILMVMNFQVAEAQDEKETLVLIETDMGKIKVKLYNDTPLHRDNFIKNVKEHLYDGLLFHRVIRQFMVQAGDIHSKDAPADKHLGDGDPDYTIPAEIVYPKHYHKAGALCAARTADEVNPKRESSASQFYIVTGKFFTSMELDKLDGQYTVFGEVVDGLKSVFKIQMVETNSEDDRPLKNIKIKTMKIVEK